ncbi:hypothetical protein [Curtobacterium flaccumfaciens]|uniref:hypothetical protein n=1 Tax=Curtobacterium flaccumfaciens TaxID=2035 RepID=UPI0021FAE323|nr:hypothetical protein [Curtobacterium flaccumfaciens]UWD79301.1 hypothetical protein NY058_00560 [Curtobacterium flaccumfaciens]
MSGVCMFGVLFGFFGQVVGVTASCEERCLEVSGAAVSTIEVALASSEKDAGSGERARDEDGDVGVGAGVSERAARDSSAGDAASRSVHGNSFVW